MKYWFQAEDELSYRLKREMHNNNVTEEEAKKIVQPAIRDRAFLLYCAAKDDCEEIWSKSKEEFYRRADFYSETEQYADTLPNFMPKIVRSKYAQLEFIKTHAYFCWENNCNMNSDWYDSEKEMIVEIAERAKYILEKEIYFSLREAFYCACDQLNDEIKVRAYFHWENKCKKRKWVSERAYYIWETNPKSSSEQNWEIAEREYDAKIPQRR